MKASDFRRQAREGLRGQWLMAIIATVIAGIFGGTISGSGNASSLFSSASSANESGALFDGSLSDIPPSIIIGTVLTIVGVALVISVVMLCVGSCIRLGYAQYICKVANKETASLDQLFAQFKRFKVAICTDFLRYLYTFLWSLLFFIPGIIKSYSYAMTPFLLSDHPEMTATEAITASRKMMDGHKFELFCLHFSFIGWSLAAICTCFIGFFWLAPYTEVSVAAFYLNLKQSNARLALDL